MRVIRRAPGCDKPKKLYTSYRRAARAAGGRQHDAGPLRIYWCPPCGGYHITSQVVDQQAVDR